MTQHGMNGTGCRNAVAILLAHSHNSWTVSSFSRQCVAEHVQLLVSAMSVHQQLYRLNLLLCFTVCAASPLYLC